MFLEIGIVSYILLITMIIKKFNEIDEKRIINIVLSKLQTSINHHKIIKKNNKIYIKCHYYCKNIIISRNNSSYNSVLEKDYLNNYNIIYYENNSSYKKILNNYDPIKNIGIIIFDIIIDMKIKKYEIITSKFHIINVKIDYQNIYTKIINYLDNPEYYIILNGIYDKDFKLFGMNGINNIYEDYYKYDKSFKLYYKYKEFNMTITNDKKHFIINSILSDKSSDTIKNIEVSPDIDTKPHIDNDSFIISKISGSFL